MGKNQLFASKERFATTPAKTNAQGIDYCDPRVDFGEATTLTTGPVGHRAPNSLSNIPQLPIRQQRENVISTLDWGCATLRDLITVTSLPSGGKIRGKYRLYQTFSSPLPRPALSWKPSLTHPICGDLNVHS